MRNILNKMLWFFAFATVLCSCDKDGDLLYMNGFGSSDLIATTDNVVLSTANSKKVVLSLAWKNPTLLSSDSTKTVADGTLKTYLQVSPSSDFSGTVSETTVTTLSKAYFGDDLNNLSKELGLATDTSTPLYFRIKGVEGDNMDPAYSNVCKVDITPYTIHMNSVSVLNEDKTDTLATLYSDSENGVYTGYMNATSWMHCWFAENDGTVWGNYAVDGHPFELSSASDAWNCWFAEGNGIWFVTADTKNALWSGEIITSVTLNGEEMSYSSATGSWSLVVTTTAANTAIGGSAATKEFTSTTGTGSYTEKTITLPDSVLTNAGTYTVELVIGSHAQLEYKITEGTVTPDVQETPLPTALYMYTTDGGTLLATLTTTGDGIYTTTYAAQQWENFKFIDTENNIWYGSDPSDLFTISSEAGSYNIWFKDDFTSGTELTVTANLKTKTWQYSVK